MPGLLGQAFFALIVALRARKITKPGNSGSREKPTIIANTLLDIRAVSKITALFNGLQHCLTKNLLEW